MSRSIFRRGHGKSGFFILEIEWELWTSCNLLPIQHSAAKHFLWLDCWSEVLSQTVCGPRQWHRLLHLLFVSEMLWQCAVQIDAFLSVLYFSSTSPCNSHLFAHLNMVLSVADIDVMSVDVILLKICLFVCWITFDFGQFLSNLL